MLKLNRGYLLHDIGGCPCLLPYGQNIADFRRSIRLNESGVLICRALENGADESSILAALISHYQADESDIPALKEDLSNFLFQLEANGILIRQGNVIPEPSEVSFQIGPAVISYFGPEELLAPSLFSFSCKSDKPDMSFYVIPSAPATHAVGEVLVRTEELTICRNESSYLFFYPAGYGIAEAHVSLDGRRAAFFCPKPYGEELCEKLFHAFRFAYLIRAQQMGAFALHSSSVLYQGKAWLFSGPSGAGKSTHAALWNRLYDTPYLNGDLNLLGYEDGSPIVYGIPWCGTSGCYTTKTTLLGGITFLNQAPTDSLLPLNAQETAFRTMQRLVSPSWTAQMLLSNLSFAEELSGCVPCFLLRCTKEESAASLMKQAIDRQL